ncbi:FTR1 family protein [Erythrobacter sp.]|uniref:FTR1 family protein n=1 Tax=Erythrobacter sp. TaxID=1042 RepID=UPI003C77D10A
MMNFQAAVTRFIALLLILIALPSAAIANGNVQTTWRLLDYIAVDYAGAIEDGRIINEVEYAEMTDFSATVAERMAVLPPNPQRAVLVAGAEALSNAIAAKSAPELVARDARRLASELLAVYPVPLAPQTVPDLARGAVLYTQNCASCHGISGDGNGPSAAGLDPAPIAFDDVTRARERSVFALYQVIGQGLDGTAMQSFADLPAEDRWALALYTGTIAFADIERGKQLWENDASVRERFPDLAAVTSTTPSALGEAIGAAKADAVMAFLRAHPEAVEARALGSLSLARERLQESLAAYEAGQMEEARDLALSAYLDGFEPLEGVLSTRDARLMASIESAMADLRFAIGEGQSIEIVGAKVAALDSLFADAETTLAPDNANAASIFVGSFTILLREGLEALLIVIAMVAFLRKAERSDVLPYVHGGWIAALIAGGATWIAATYFINVSGASRELMEGFGSLFAAVVLLSVGIWMHGKSQAGEWQRYIRKTMDKALSRGSAWFLFGLAFLVVYREVFETILFYAALWTQGNGGLILAGASAAILLLALIAWVMLRYSRSLPVGTFFAYSSVLMAVLAVVLVGKGVAGLQEAGLVSITPLSSMPRIPALGLFPTLQPTLAQLSVVALIGLGFWFNRKNSERSISVQVP